MSDQKEKKVENDAERSVGGSEGKKEQKKGKRRGKSRRPRKNEESSASNSDRRSKYPHEAVLAVQHLRDVLTEQGVKIAMGLIREQYNCLICFNSIRRISALWSCPHCFVVLHLGCIQRWLNSCTKEKTDLRCPVCQLEIDRDCAKKYKCFCGQVEEPDFQPFLIPHSCGNLCMKMRTGTQCPHPCHILCHPGKCPPCELLAPPKSCFCGKTSYQLFCSEVDDGRSCGDICDRTLNCGLHLCKEVCHKGECAECTSIVKHNCFCGKESRMDTCEHVEDMVVFRKDDDEVDYLVDFSCGNQCGYVYSCGVHSCQRLCHSDKHSDICPFDPSVFTHCPCGKELITSPRESCSDPIPTCDNMCGKLLKCGIHKCQKNCHIGECGDCAESVDVTCRCGAETVVIPCWVTYLGEDRNLADLTTFKVSCICEDIVVKDGELRVGDVSYPLMPYKCKRVCGEKMSCVRHRCKEICCPAKNSQYSDVDGIHVCRKVCGQSLRCGNHTCEEVCHRGRCPPCQHIITSELTCYCGRSILEPPQPCGTQPPPCTHECTIERPCGHRPEHICHFGPCPPCTIPVTRMCVGGHRKVQVPCSVESFPCHSKCGKVMSCGIHKCSKRCHDGPCEEEGDICTQICNCSLSCGHKCKQKCHSGDPCNSLLCEEGVVLWCPCLRRNEQLMCKNVQKLVIEDKNAVYFTEDGRTVGVECDRDCDKNRRNRNLANALGISESTPLCKTPAYSRGVQRLGRQQYSFLLQLEEQLEALVNEPRFTRHNFPHMSSNKRGLICRLASYYNMDSQELDGGRNSSVSVLRTPLTMVPNVLLSAFLATAKEYIDEDEAVQQRNALLFFDLDQDFSTAQLRSLLDKEFAGTYSLERESNTEIVVSFCTLKTLRTCKDWLTKACTLPFAETSVDV